MNLPLFIAKRIYSDQGDKRKVSRPAIRIAVVGVAIGLMVMIITVCVVLGFKHTIRDKVAGFGGHIQVTNLMKYNEIDPYTICPSDSLMQVFSEQPGVRHIQRYTITQGLLKTDNDFLGVMFKGVGPEFDNHFLEENIVAGEIAIRHHYHGETSFYILPEHDERLMQQIQATTFADPAIDSMITGWLDYEDDDHFLADLYLLSKPLQ